MSDPAHDAFPWAVRGALAGGLGALGLLTREHPWLVPTSPMAWSGTALLALCLLLTAEAVRRRSDRWSQGLVGAGVATLLTLGLLLAMTRPAPEAGYPVLLAAAAYAFLRLGMDAGLPVVAAGVAAGSLLGGGDAGTTLLLCVLFIAFSSPVPSRWQIVSLIGIGLVCGVLDQVGWVFPGLSLLALVIPPWLLHFGSPRPWRWTAITALLALFWFWPTGSEEPRTAEVALATAAGLLLLAVPLVRQLARQPDSTAARSALQPLLAATVVAVAWTVPLWLAPRWPWSGALLMVPLLGWVAWRLSARWLWLPAVMAALAALRIWVDTL